MTLNCITSIRISRNCVYSSSFSASSTSTEPSSGSKVCTVLLDYPQIGKLSFLCAKGTNCTIQLQSIAHVEIIDDSLISRWYASQWEVDQIFITKSKLVFLKTDFCVEVEYRLVFLHDRDVLLFAGSLTVVKELTKTSCNSSRVIMVKGVKHLFGGRQL